MSAKDLSSSVKSSIEAIVAYEFGSSPSTIEVAPGSEIGDGYASKTLSITIKGNEKTINLFIKYYPENVNNSFTKPFLQAFNTEFRFYDEIYPIMVNFQMKKNLKEEEMFDSVPKHYKTGLKYDGHPPIILENLRISGYTLRNHKEPIDDAHITLALKAFAKYHAISFAMKDQEPEQFKNLHDGMQDFFSMNMKTMGFIDSFGSLIDSFVTSLDPAKDRNLWDKCRNLRELLMEHFCNVHTQVDDYAVICQGDCWSNNMMFQYDKESGSPINVKLIDWQIQRYNSPVLDVSYFFYTVSTKEVLKDFDRYFDLYYDALAEFIKTLGSDAAKVYPKAVFLEHWKKFAKTGLFMSFGTFFGQTAKQEEMPDFIDSETPSMPGMPENFENKHLYHSKIRCVVEHFIERDFL